MKDSERNQKGKEFEASGDIDSAIVRRQTKVNFSLVGVSC